MYSNNMRCRVMMKESSDMLEVEVIPPVEVGNYIERDGFGCLKAMPPLERDGEVDRSRAVGVAVTGAELPDGCAGVWSER